MTTRLNKYISESGFCSRREADRFIEQGNVFVNGKRAAIGGQVGGKDRVVVNGHAIEPRAAEDAVYIAFNKPPGITSTTERGVKGNIIDYIKHSVRIFPIGRLDKESQGLILLTSNGDIVNKILRAGNKHEKEYIVMVDKPIRDEFIEGMASGVSILGVMTQKCAVVKETSYIFRITLIQGMNRQIRRMCEAFGYEVVQLERIRVMNITLKGIGVGDWRELTEREMAEIFEMTKKSIGTREASLPRRTARPEAPVWTARPPRKTAAPGEKPARKSAAPASTQAFDKPARPARKTAAGKLKPSPALNFAEDKPPRKPARPAGPGAKFKPAAKTLSRAPKGNSGTRG
ncbi:MAG: 23S rRNA pseudouridine(2604) synthase RluF, partial [Hymenobacter sp.]|nr:23S rRNA pseudouridine(2604) synthase RluF [Hymenobacter sp.]